MIFRRSPLNPVLTRESIPAIGTEIVDTTSVFNPGAAWFRGTRRLLLRVQTRGRRTFLVPAEQDDGFRYRVAPRVAVLEGLEDVPGTVHHVYDPRLTALGDEVLVTVAIDRDDDGVTGIARTDDFERFEFRGVADLGDTRNAVLFPEKLGGRYALLHRPNHPTSPGEPPSGDEIRLATSDDLLAWEDGGAVLRGRPRYWDERIGSGPPPVKTREGWLHLYHGVATHFGSASVYQAGAVLLDLADPTQVRARTRDNVLEPREGYELTGQVPNVVFPTGLIVTETDDEGFARPEARAELYYGAADTSVCYAHTTVGELLRACRDF